MNAASLVAGATRMPSRILVLVLKGYQKLVSPLMAPHCRFYPSCSSYGVTALGRHGLWKGSVLTAWRLMRCQPFHPGGVDHVPERGRWRPGLVAAVVGEQQTEGRIG